MTDTTTVSLVQDLDRPGGWLLLVGSSEQSYVLADDPSHLEFEYVQHISHVITAGFPSPAAIEALHLGGGLCTLPRWIEFGWPGSRQRVVERSEEIATMCRSVPLPPGIEIELADVDDWLAASHPLRRRPRLAVIDVYAGPNTVTSPFALDGLQRLHGMLHHEALIVSNLSDAAPFNLARTVAATMRMLWSTVVVIAEPAILRGRRSGNFVTVATSRPLDIDEITRRCASGPVRGRVIAGADLDEWIGDAVAAATAVDLPESGELDSTKWI